MVGQLLLYKDQQKILLRDCKRNSEEGTISFGGEREDGTTCWVTLKLADDNTDAKVVAGFLEDIENALMTLAAYCSPTGQAEIEGVAK